MFDDFIGSVYDALELLAGFVGFLAAFSLIANAITGKASRPAIAEREARKVPLRETSCLQSHSSSVPS